uniref:Putative secreted protein n=1 Tax=Anopheles darlingi TaxID=43151 RepID=A0A2M4DRK8_ANODA
MVAMATWRILLRVALLVRWLWRECTRVSCDHTRAQSRREVVPSKHVMKFRTVQPFATRMIRSHSMPSIIPMAPRSPHQA